MRPVLDDASYRKWISKGNAYLRDQLEEQLEAGHLLLNRNLPLLLRHGLPTYQGDLENEAMDPSVVGNQEI